MYFLMILLVLEEIQRSKRSSIIATLVIFTSWNLEIVLELLTIPKRVLAGIAAT